MSEAAEPRAPLSLWVRILLFLVGWTLLLLGIAGLVLPGIQGIVTILAGATVLSLGSEVAFKTLRYLFRAWPSGWKRIVKLRERLHAWMERFGKKGAGADPPNPIDVSPRPPPTQDE